MIPVAMDGRRSSTRVVSGRTSPRRGWVSERMLERSPAPVVTMSGTGRSADLLTVLVPTAKSSNVRAAVRNVRGGGEVLTVTVDGRHSRFRVAANGTLSRI